MRYSNLIAAFTGGDQEIADGLSKWRQNHEALSADHKPLPSPYSKEQQAWLEQVLAIYRQSK